MTDNSNLAMNILELPLEMPEKIISLVADQLTVGQTCRTFYEISCRLKCFKIIVRPFTAKHPGIDVNEMEKNEELFQSIASSKRKITAMRLKFYKCPDFKCQRSIKMLFEKFGYNLSELQISHFNLSLEHFVKSEDRSGSFQLNMPNLRKLTIKGCESNVFKVFNHLPDNVLSTVAVYDCKGSDENVFRNQRNIKEIVWHASKNLAIDTSNLKLESLRLSKESYSRQLIVGQGSITSLWLDIIPRQEDIDAISTLVHLEELRFEVHHSVNLSPLRKLTKLGKLNVISVEKNDRSLETLQSFSVNDLTIYKRDFDRDFAENLSLNCPNVRKLEIPRLEDDDDDGDELDPPSWMGLKALLEKYPNLESLATPLPFTSIFPSRFVHRNLKRLKLKSYSQIPGIKILLEACVNLETFETDLIDAERLEAILTVRPNLKALYVKMIDEFSEGFLNTFGILGRNLESFHFTDRSLEDDNNYIERVTQINNGVRHLVSCLKIN